jgi:O-antigen/teichoic acid export membrane protein
VVLQNQMAEFKAKNDELISEKATIGFLDFSISKANYSISMWTLFLGTLIAAVILFLSFKRANKVTKDSKATLVDLEEEYQSYRGVCVDREQSLRRQLLMK